MQVAQIVVAEGLALQLLERGLAAGPAIECSVLVGILAVTQGLHPLRRQGQRLGRGRVTLHLTGEIATDGRVVSRGVAERLQGQAATMRQIGPVALQRLQHPAIVCGIDQHDDPLEILGPRPQQRHPADVDVLHSFGFGHIGPGDGLLEGIEIADHDVDGREAMFGQLRPVGVGVAGQNRPVDGGVQGLDPPAQDLGKAGDIDHGGDGQARLGDGPSRASAGDEFHAQVMQTAGEFDESGFVG